MIKKVKQIGNILVKNKILILFLILLIAVLSPIFINNIYNFPAADDFYGINELKALFVGKPLNIITFFQVGIERTANIYMTWQGNYFTLFMGVFNPLLLSLKAYNWMLFLIQLFFVFSIIFFFLCLSKSIKIFSRKQAIILSVTYITVSILSMYSVSEGLYWYSGAMLYLLPFALSMVLMGLLALYINKKNKALYSLILLLLICLAGTNYITGLFIGSLLLIVTIYAFFRKKQYFATLLIALLVFGVAFAFNVFAPGNFLRISGFEKVSIIKALAMTIPLSVEMLLRTIFKTLLIPFLIIFTPGFARAANKYKKHIKLINPAFIILCSLVIFALFFAPCTYSYGSLYQETRVQNIQFFYLILIISFDYFYVILYILKNKNNGFLMSKDFNPICLIVGLSSLILMVSAIDYNNLQSVSVTSDVIHKKSSTYNQCMNNMNKVLSENNQKTVIVSNCEPVGSLHYAKLMNDDWVVNGMEKYYGKEIIIN
jgi:hypothetical protein